MTWRILSLQLSPELLHLTGQRQKRKEEVEKEVKEEVEVEVEEEVLSLLMIRCTQGVRVVWN